MKLKDRIEKALRREPAPMSNAGLAAVAAAKAASNGVTGPTTVSVAAPGYPRYFGGADEYGESGGFGSFGGTSYTRAWTRPNDLDEIAPYVFQGGELPLLPAGIEAVLNVNGAPDKFPTWQPLQGYLHLPIGDVAYEAPSVEWLGLAVGTIERFRAQGWSVFVHCAMGISRSGMVSVAYVMKKDRLTVEAALAKVRKARPITNPNSGFLRSLAAWQRHLGIGETGAATATASTAQMPIWAKDGREGTNFDSVADRLTRENIISPPASGNDADRVACPECGHKYIHASICSTTMPGEAPGEVKPPKPVITPAWVAGENLGTIVEDREAVLEPDGVGTPDQCGACGRDSLVTGFFEQAYWCPECLSDEEQHREALLDAAEDAAAAKVGA